MSALKKQEQGTMLLAHPDHLPIVVESFLIDLRANGPSRHTINFYGRKLSSLHGSSEVQAATEIGQIPWALPLGGWDPHLNNTASNSRSHDTEVILAPDAPNVVRPAFAWVTFFTPRTNPS